MKNIRKKVTLANLILLYCFVISLYNGDGFFHNSNHSNQPDQPQTETYHPTVSKSLFCHTIPTEPSYSVVTKVPVSFVKNQFTDFKEYILATKNVFRTKFLQYSFFSKKILLRLHPRNIIYPFHYFW